MNNSDNHGGDRQAAVSRLPHVSGLWLIPIVTLLVGLWMVYDHWASQGPLITISFASAEGLEEGKTKIKSRNIHIGDVLSIDLQDDLGGVLVTARMRDEIRELLVDDARFWVVQPMIGLSGVSGLGTLLAGQYIEFSPGSSENRVDHFEGLEKPPLTPPGTPGLHLTLNSIDNFSYREGHPILYQGFPVGKIEDIYFNSSERMMYYNAFIEAPYHKLVTQNTRFWDVSGIRAEVTQEGVSVQTAGLLALMLGGISFGLPDGEPAGKPVNERAYYLIHPNRAASQELLYEYAVPFTLLVDDSVSGLKAGAPVNLRGMQVGEVVRSGHIHGDGNLLDQTMKIPINIEIHAGRLGLPDTEKGKSEAREGLIAWLAAGMTASIKTSNPLLGQHIVELGLRDESTPLPVTYFEGMAVIPVIAGSGLDGIIAKVNDLLGNLNQLEIAEIGASADQLLKETTVTMQRVQELASSGKSVLSDAHQEELMKSLNVTLLEFRALAENYGANFPAGRELNQLLETMVDVLSDLEPLLIELNNRPNSLIFTGRGEAEPEPERKKP